MIDKLPKNTWDKPLPENTWDMPIPIEYLGKKSKLDGGRNETKQRTN